MVANSQLGFDWTAPPPTTPAPAPSRGPSYRDLKAFVQRVRLGGVEALRTLKRLVEAALEAETLTITDEDIPF